MKIVAPKKLFGVRFAGENFRGKLRVFFRKYFEIIRAVQKKIWACRFAKYYRAPKNVFCNFGAPVQCGGMTGEKEEV